MAIWTAKFGIFQAQIFNIKLSQSLKSMLKKQIRFVQNLRQQN